MIYLNKETAAGEIINIIFHGGTFTCKDEDWPEVRPVVLLQATVWESEGKPHLAAAARRNVERVDAKKEAWS